MAKPSTYRLMMNIAWKDHLHTRDQTWKSLQIESILAAGLLGIDLKIGNEYELATIVIGFLVIASAYFGAKITIHHRLIMIKNFAHISKCEEHLGLIGDVITEFNINDSPSPLKFWHVFDPRKNNTVTYILRMHIAIVLFAFVLILIRIVPLALNYTSEFLFISIPLVVLILIYLAFGAGVTLSKKSK
jgi:hypothetical protein